MALAALLASAALLSTALSTDPQPWAKIEAGSEQRAPVYVGSTPYQLMIDGIKAEYPVLPKSMQDKLEAQARLVRESLGEESVELEAWPVQDDEGQRTWAFARWRKSGQNEWSWLDSKELKLAKSQGTKPILAEALKPWRRADESRIFDDFLTLNSLYDKPAFGECIWTTEDGMGVHAAWLPPSRAPEIRARIGREIEKGKRSVCHLIPQIARFNDKPISFLVRVSGGRVALAGDLQWERDRVAHNDPIDADTVVTYWPAEFESDYRLDVETIAGERMARFPISGRTARFTRKNSADSGNRIAVLIEYLEERYAKLGIKTMRQEFQWRGITQYNLIAVIPGTTRDGARRPVLMADHIDTAFSEETFDKTGERVSAPGADDNGTAVAALLRAAELLRGKKLRKDVWLVHLTGEEFPADCLGARYLLSLLLREKKDISGLVLMDMIGYRNPKSGMLFQLNAGESPQSKWLARVALDASADVAPGLAPVLRDRFDPRSYLYNTDGIIFSDNGYPVVLFNEHINKLENLNRPHYHQESDTSDKIDFAYASSIAKVAIETAARLAR